MYVYDRTPGKRGIEDNSKIFFLFFNENIDCNPLVEPCRRDGSNKGSHYMLKCKKHGKLSLIIPYLEHLLRNTTESKGSFQGDASVVVYYSFLLLVLVCECLYLCLCVCLSLRACVRVCVSVCVSLRAYVVRACVCLCVCVILYITI